MYSKFSRPRPNIKIVQLPRRLTHQSVLTRPLASLPGSGVGRPVRISLVRRERGTDASPLRNFDTEPQSPYCYEVVPDNRLESVANAHTAADLHVRPAP